MTPLELLLLSAEFVENKEGVVITFADGKMAKSKNIFYASLHGLLTSGLKAHLLIPKILDQEIDDVLAFIPTENVDARKYIEALTQVIVRHVNDFSTECYEFFQQEFKGDRKEFALKFKPHPLFKFVTVLIKDNTYENIEEVVVRHVMKACRRQQLANEYLTALGFTLSPPSLCMIDSDQDE